MSEREVDARGLSCPEPVVRTRRMMLEEGVETVLQPERAAALAREGLSAAGVLGRLLTMPPDPATVFSGVDMNVACPALNGPEEQMIDILYDLGLLGVTMDLLI